MSEQYNNPLDIVLPEEQQAMDTLKKYESRTKLIAMVDKCNNMDFLFKVALILKDGAHGVKKNIIRACSVLSKLSGVVVMGLSERGELLRPLHELNIHMKYELSGDEQQNLSKLEEFVSFSEKKLKKHFDLNNPITEQIFNKLCGGKLVRKALKLVDELTNPELIYQIAMYCKDGKNGFEQHEKKSEYYMNMAAGYLHAKALDELSGNKLFDELGLLAMSIDEERFKHDPLFRAKYESEYEEGLSGVLEFMAKERRDTLEAQGDVG